MFEHTVTYVPVRYHEGEEQGLIFKHRGPQTDPDPASLANDPNFGRLYLQMGQDDWELVGVQPLLQGQCSWSTNMNQSFGLGFSITAGYYFFWKRSVAPSK